ncbi:MAG TPA: hypothetical protein VGQ99_01960 [Tepidisphaeraceae bacterium]|jgi:hypothetical protein|nr:hypothetical protein [Tepidisphaeraceae bacterium]
MLRRTRTILCGLSLLLFLTLLISWPFAQDKPVGVFCRRTEPLSTGTITIQTPHFYFLAIDANQLALGHWRDPQLMEMFAINQGQMQEDVSYFQSLLEMDKIHPTGNQTRLENDLKRKQRELAQHKNRGFSKADGLHFGPDPRHPWFDNPPNTKSFMGITYHYFFSQSPPATVQRWMIPLWLPLLLLATPPLLRLRSGYRKYRLRRSNLCPSCGYDLRATPHPLPRMRPHPHPPHTPVGSTSADAPVGCGSPHLSSRVNGASR